MPKHFLALVIFLVSIQGSSAQAPLELPPPRLLPYQGSPVLPSPQTVPGPSGLLDRMGGTNPESRPPSYGVLEDRNGAMLIGNPLLDGGNSCHLGWFATAEIQLLDPHVINQLTGAVMIQGTTTTVRLPIAELNWSVAPHFELGYRFGQGAGELLISYRFLTSSGRADTAGFDALGNPGALRSRFNMNVIDLDYASQENALLPGFNMKWRVGVRIASLYFDSEETSPLLHQHVTNYFYGAGPHLGLDLGRPIPYSRTELFCRIDGAGVLGKIYQSVEETLPGLGSDYQRQSQFMPTTLLNVQAGLAWTPAEFWRFSVGYSYEHWWDIAVVGSSRGEVWSQGVFFRGEWKF